MNQSNNFLILTDQSVINESSTESSKNMSPRTAQQLSQLKQDKRVIIMDAALRLFAEKGFHSTSVAEIAKEAKIAKGLIYSYFDSKETILKTITKEGLDDTFKVFSLFHNTPIQSDEQIKQLIDALINRVLEKKEFYKLYYSMFLHPHVMEAFEAEMAEAAAKFTAPLLAYFVEKGDEDPESTILFIQATLDGLLFNTLFNPHIFRIEKLKPKLWKLLKKEIS